MKEYVTLDPLDFSDEQLSMILSHVAGGGALCCAAAADARATIARSKRQDVALATFAYDSTGCGDSKYARRWFMRWEARCAGESDYPDLLSAGSAALDAYEARCTATKVMVELARPSMPDGVP